ncbi:MAG: extracellular solute-binding protein [Candidatus Krumholzibacteriota bacterium]|nr:extracellular solute-binding protein [Candidatus Krumholzibacteriota bacterium]
MSRAKRLRRLAVLLVAASPLFAGGISCGGDTDDIIVFHAGSLSVPFRRIADDFEAAHPGVRVLLEAAGSRSCARKIADLGRPADVMASADYTVIDELLIPEHASWNIRFASNEMAIVYRTGSTRAGEISVENWHEVLLDDAVAFGRSDPDSDPCGYRAVLTAKLAERYYGVPGLAARLLRKDGAFIRPKETDLIALLESGAIDYAFLYRSVAMQHGLPFLVLPDEINLKRADLAGLYAAVEVEVSGRRPGTTIVKRGAPMVYGVTIPRQAPHQALALAFVEYLLDAERGMAAMEAAGQPSVVPSPTDSWEALPARLRRFALPPAGGRDAPEGGA